MSILRNKANPCSTDEYGLTPLMYAVFNGHLECVKWLLANDKGVDNQGVKRSSIHMQTIKGYTALHLHCQDCLSWANETLVWLLAAGAIVNTKCKEGMTAEEFLVKANNQYGLEILRKFKALKDYHGNGDPDLDEFRQDIDRKRADLADNYAYEADASVIVEPWDADFPVPAFIFEPQRVGNLPIGLKVYEHHIKPLMEVGYNGGNDMSKGDAIRCLNFTDEQAEINRARREGILKVADPNWIPPDKIDPIGSKMKIRNVKKRTDDDYEGMDVVRAVDI